MYLPQLQAASGAVQCANNNPFIVLLSNYSHKIYTTTYNTFILHPLFLRQTIRIVQTGISPSIAHFLSYKQPFGPFWFSYDRILICTSSIRVISIVTCSCCALYCLFVLSGITACDKQCLVLETSPLVPAAKRGIVTG